MSHTLKEEIQNNDFSASEYNPDNNESLPPDDDMVARRFCVSLCWR